MDLLWTKFSQRSSTHICNYLYAEATSEIIHSNLVTLAASVKGNWMIGNAGYYFII